MNSALWYFLEDALFYLVLALDFILVFSLVFAFIYAAVLIAASFVPVRFRSRLISWGPLLLLIISLAAALSLPGDLAARGLGAIFYALAEPFGHPWPQAVMVGLWLAGALAGLVILARRYSALTRLMSTYEEVPGDGALIRALEAVKPTRPVKLMRSAGTGWPVVSWGFRLGRVGIPADFQQTHDEEERYVIYLHELTHLKHRDAFKYLFLSGLSRFFWFNPVLGHALERYKNHLEIVCDRSVIQAGPISPETYARLISKTVTDQNRLLAGFSSGFHDLARRLGYIFQDAQMTKPQLDRRWGTVFLVVALLFLGGFGLAKVPEEELTPGEVRAVTAPDGAPGTLKVKFYWRGALGTYSLISVEKKRPEENPRP